MDIEQARKLVNIDHLRTYFRHEVVDAIEWVFNTYDLNIGWISVDDRLPEDDSLVLIFDRVFHKPYIARLEWDKWVDENFIPCSPTHWIPLPTPPDTREEE